MRKGQAMQLALVIVGLAAVAAAFTMWNLDEAPPLPEDLDPGQLEGNARAPEQP